MFVETVKTMGEVQIHQGRHSTSSQSIQEPKAGSRRACCKVTSGKARMDDQMVPHTIDSKSIVQNTPYVLISRTIVTHVHPGRMLNKPP